MMNIIDFQPFLDSQISRISRYKTGDREILTLVFIQANKNQVSETLETLQNNLRESDVIFHTDDFFFLVLPQTDLSGGLHIEEVLKDFLDRKDLCLTIASLPENGTTKEELFNSISTVCESSHNIDFKNYLP